MKISKKNQCSMHIAQTSASIERKLTKMDTSTLAILAIILRRRKRRVHSRYAKRCYLNLNDDGRRKRGRRIPRIVLVEPKMSAWRKILSSGNDQSLITTTGLDFSVFGELKGRFEPMYSKYSLVPVGGKCVKLKDTSGRRRLINGEDCLGLVLVWSRTRGNLAFLQLIFRLSRTGIEVYLRFGKGMLVKLLSRDINSKLGMPTRMRVEAYKVSALVPTRGGLLGLCFNFEHV